MNCFVQGLEVFLEDGVDDVLGIMWYNNEYNIFVYSEVEEVLVKQFLGQLMFFFFFGYWLWFSLSWKGYDMKENRRSLVENDGGGLIFVNWFLVRYGVLQI